MNPPADLVAIIDLALREDVGPGDWTTLWTVPEDERVRARIVAKSPGVLAGIEAARFAFLRLDSELEVSFEAADGDSLEAGAVVARIAGSARSILTGERVALNLLQRLSGVSTSTRRYVAAVAGTGTRILDTRKTTPGLRRLEKEAVLHGGGYNHRFGLYDMILIKENHIRAAGGISRAVAAVAARNREGLRVEVEATTLEEVAEAIAAGVDRILFDNMEPRKLVRAVRLVRESTAVIETEASGGISLQNVRAVAETGVDYISVGALTHSAPALDLSLLIDSERHD